MGIRYEIASYVDSNGLICPCKAPDDGSNGSFNGVMYTSEYYIILKKLYESGADKGDMFYADLDVKNFKDIINRCIDDHGLLNRLPIPKAGGHESVDDYYGVLSACKELGVVDIPRKFLKAVIHYLGSLNNVNPGQWTFNSFLIRQPQLFCAMISAAFPSYLNPIHIIIRSICLPLYVMTAAIIFTSCHNEPTDDTDARRLAWHVINTVKPVSFLVHLASKRWYARLQKDYGPDLMRQVAYKAYEPHGEHPFAKYWIS